MVNRTPRILQVEPIVRELKAINLEIRELERKRKLIENRLCSTVLDLSAKTIQDKIRNAKRGNSAQ